MSDKVKCVAWKRLTKKETSLTIKRVSNELSTLLIKVGYRQMTEMTETITVKYNINVSKNDVLKVLKELNPSDVKTGGESLLHVVYMIPTDWLMCTTLMAMINLKGAGLRCMAALTNLVERYYRCMSLQATMILQLLLIFTWVVSINIIFVLEL